MGFPDGSNGKESSCNAEDTGDTVLISGSGRSLGGGNGNPLQFSCLKNPMDGGAWQFTVHGVARVGDDLSSKSPPQKRTRHGFLDIRGAIFGLSHFVI